MLQLATAQWKPLPDHILGPGLGKRYEICAAGAVRVRKVRGELGGAGFDGQVLMPQFVNRRPVYILSYKGDSRRLKVVDVVAHFGAAPGTFDAKQRLPELREAAEAENARLKRLNSARASRQEEEFRKQITFVPSFCPWRDAKVRGTALGADPVLGF